MDVIKVDVVDVALVIDLAELGGVPFDEGDGVLIGPRGGELPLEAEMGGFFGGVSFRGHDCP